MEITDTQMTTLRDVFYARQDEFQENYTFDEPDEVIRALAATGEMLDLIFVHDEAAIAMTALRALIANGTRTWDWSVLSAREIDRDWRHTWREINGWDASSTPPFLDELLNLNAFAHHGIALIWYEAGAERLHLPEAEHLRSRLEAVRDMPVWVEEVCTKIDRLERIVPRNADGSSPLSETLATRDIARARVKLDQGKPLTVHELADLSGVSVKRVQNAIYAKTEEAPVVDRNGLISPEACEPWLTARDYQPSIWKQVATLYPLGRDWGEDVPFEENEPNQVIHDYVFVPVANDGSVFSPDLRRSGKGHDGGYTIGAKGSERVITGFDDALEELKRMETPRWRRPNSESGNWGIVSGQTWKRVRRSDLEGIAR